ncbi:MAG: alpha/beta hydrolase [Deltaproteobacteria bacterium]|nr:alpha/beta hydrolase [Deltaproteobacteria bacterium]
MNTQQKIGDGRFDVEMQVCGSGEPLLYLHGAGGLIGMDPFLEELGKDFKVVAPHLPGYGQSTGGELIEDVIDACLFYHQLMDDLGIASAHIVGHSMGGMLAAEMAALDVHRIKKLVLVGAAGFWLDQHPIPDPFAMGLPDLAAHLFHDPKSPLAQIFTTIPTDPQQLADMYVERTKRLTQASRFLWPLPDRGLKKRTWRIAAPTLVVWGESDRMIPPVYAGEFTSHVRNSRSVTIKEAGHMVMYEQPQAFVKTVRDFLKN